MKLYHGTTADVARLALDEGLCPRGVSGVTGNWEHTVPSASDRVYLTSAYAPYFAAAAQPEELSMADQRWGVVEIETDLLELDDDGQPLCLCPDEDWLEQGSRGEIPKDHVFRDIGLQHCKTMEERTTLLREYAPAFAHNWPASIDGLGNCAHVGCIDPDAITRVSILEPAKAREIVFAALDPMISIMNYAVCGEKYRALTRWFFEPVEAQEIFTAPFWDFPDMPESHLSAMREQADKARAVVENRYGITIIEGAGA
jgi:hypothetical protein